MAPWFAMIWFRWFEWEAFFIQQLLLKNIWIFERFLSVPHLVENKASCGWAESEHYVRTHNTEPSCKIVRQTPDFLILI